MNLRNKTKDFIYNLKFNELLSTIIGLSFSYFYLIYPVWLIPGSILFNFLTFISLWILNIFLVYFTSSFIKKYEEEIKSILNDMKNYLKISIKILIILFLIFVIIFFENIFFTPLESRGDEPAHIYRIIRFTLIWTLNDFIPTQISFIIIIIILGLISYLFFQISKIPRKTQQIFFFLKKKLTLILIAGPILLILIILILVENLNILDLSYSGLSRYGPIHTSIYAIPVFLFGWSHVIIPIWRIMNIITSLGTLFLSSFLLSLLFRHNKKKISNNRKILSIRLFLNYLFVLPLFFFPAIIRFTFSVWLTTGVLFFSILSFVFILWFLIEPSKKKKKALLFMIAIIFGYGMLWKEIFLFQPIIFVLFIVLKNIPNYFKRLQKNSKIHYLKTILNFGIIISIIGIPFRFFSIYFNPRPSYSENINIFSFSQYFDYFYSCYLEIGIMADIFFISLLLLIIIAIYKKQYYLIYFPLAFFMWYTFYYIMIFGIYPISIQPDRVMNIPILILVLSFAILIFNISFRIPIISKKNTKKIHNIIRMSIIIIILIPSSIIGYEYLQDTKKEKHLPYEPVANYIVRRWDNNSEKIYYDFGPNSLKIYFFLEGFLQNEFFDLYNDIFLESEHEEFTTVEEFLNYSFQQNVRFITLPNKEKCRTLIRPIVEDLISLGLNDTIEMVKFAYYDSYYYIWDLRSY